MLTEHLLYARPWSRGREWTPKGRRVQPGRHRVGHHCPGDEGSERSQPGGCRSPEEQPRPRVRAKEEAALMLSSEAGLRQGGREGDIPVRGISMRKSGAGRSRMRVQGPAAALQGQGWIPPHPTPPCHVLL